METMPTQKSGPYDLDQRLEEIAHIREDYPIFFSILLVAVLVGIMIGLGFNAIQGFDRDLYLEVISIVLTVGVLNVLERYRDKRRQVALHNTLNWNYGKNVGQPEPHRVFFEMIVHGALSGYKTTWFDIRGFKCKGFRIRKAWFEKCNMRDTGWEQCDFGRSQFYWVDLQRATFVNCLLRYVVLEYCKLEKVQINGASLKGAKLIINMNEGWLVDVDLANADLSESSFESVYFSDIDLRGANLDKVSLAGAQLSNIRCDGSTRLPDGTSYNASKGMEQFKRFVDPKSEDFYKVEVAAFGLGDMPGNKEEETK